MRTIKINWIAIASVATSIVALLTYLALSEAQNTRELIEKRFQIDIQPWVFIDGIRVSSTIQFDHSNNSYDLESVAVFMNSGKSPAFNVQVIMDMFSYTTHNDTLVTDSITALSPDTVSYTFYLYPSQSLHFPFTYKDKLNEPIFKFFLSLYTPLAYTGNLNKSDFFIGMVLNADYEDSFGVNHTFASAWYYSHKDQKWILATNDDQLMKYRLKQLQN